MSDRPASGLYVRQVDVIGDIVTSMRTGTPIARRTELSGQWGLRFTGDPGAGFLVVLEGSPWLLPPLSPSPVQLHAGDVVFTPNGVGCVLADRPDTPLVDVSVSATKDQWPTFASTGEGRRTVFLCGVYALDRTRPHPVIAQLPDVVHFPADSVPIEDPLPAVVNLLHIEVAQGEPGSSAAVPALLDLLILYVLRTWYRQQAQRGVPGWPQALQDPAIRAALESIQRSPAEPWTVQTLADKAGMSRTAFARRFTDSVGEPPMTYLTRRRMTLAGKLLRETDMPLSSVASRVGYSSPFAFGKAFSRTFHSSPGSYRRRSGKQPDALSKDVVDQRDIVSIAQSGVDR
ncbi:cupin domain-containing protein [Rhodococcus sp. 27YEA15]|uniref:AraC family transcriptional regulator n=1 Tax=Rhodococcus sp. 27YEA15 TaxID=3156259 RepID=UPI003C79D576